MLPKPPFEDAFYTLEQSLHRPEVRLSIQSLEALLAADFREIGASGKIYDRNTTISALLLETQPADARLPFIKDFAASQLAEDVVLVTYCSLSEASDDRPERTTLRSSIWVMMEGAWRMRFHQGTVIPPV